MTLSLPDPTTVRRAPCTARSSWLAPPRRNADGWSAMAASKPSRKRACGDRTRSQSRLARIATPSRLRPDSCPFHRRAGAEMKESSARVEQHRQPVRPAEREALDDGGGLVGVEPEVGQPVEDRVETDAQLEPREVHAEALVRAGTERNVVLDRATQTPLRRIVEPPRVVVRGAGEHADRRTGLHRAARDLRV